MSQINFILVSPDDPNKYDFIVLIGEETIPNKYTLSLIQVRIGQDKVLPNLFPQGSFNMEDFSALYESYNKLEKKVVFVLMEDILKSNFASQIKKYFGLDKYQDWPENVYAINDFLNKFVA